MALLALLAALPCGCSRAPNGPQQQVEPAQILDHAQDPVRGEALEARRGRPRTQVHFKGTSPYFRVDFDRFTGAVSCVWCHPEVSAIWKAEESFHAETFARLDAEALQNPKCVKCHVTAFNKGGVYPFEEGAKRKSRKMGYTMHGDPEVNRYFTGVQCEACHGPNCGNKYSKEKLAAGCLKCHNEESPHFKGFDPETAMARIKHGRVGATEKIDYDAYVGLEGCFLCHWPNHEAWKRDQDFHKNAYAVLDEKGRQDPQCLKCHTTGFHADGRHPMEEEGKQHARRSGFAFGGDPARNRGFEGVQCEACHGINCGTLTTAAEIRKRCEACHSGACAHDQGFVWERDYEKARHRPPPGYIATGDPKVVLEFYDLDQGLETAGAFHVPLLVVLSNPPDG